MKLYISEVSNGLLEWVSSIFTIKMSYTDDDNVMFNERLWGGKYI